MATANSSSNILLILIQGDLDKLRDGVVFLTVHDVGTSYEVAWMIFSFTFHQKQQNNHQQIILRWPG